ncbi:MAG: CoB--CoM heterodisulfide reductase iron-sulfur subunit B family protein [Candidatus Heimdallarchaeota archaeon]
MPETKYGLYLGCVIQIEQYAYELSTTRILDELGISWEYFPVQTCCGHPIRNINSFAWLTLAGRILAKGAELGIELCVPCTGCSLSLEEANHILSENADLRERVDQVLKVENLEWQPTRVKHILQVLHDDIGIETLQNHQVATIEGVRFATHYGCHAIRPSSLPKADHAENPWKMEQIMEGLQIATGDYPERLDCCGGPTLLMDEKLAVEMTGNKLQILPKWDFNGLVTICPTCHKQFDGKQEMIARHRKEEFNFPVIYLTQLIGLCLGISEEDLGLHLNLSPINSLKEHLKKI